MEFTV